MVKSKDNHMECEIKWNAGDGISFAARTGSGHVIPLDTAKEVTGTSIGPRPMETFLVGAVACTQYDLVAGIKQAGGILHSCKAFASGIRSENSPKIFTKISVHFSIESDNISREAVQQILDASREVHGSAMKMLGQSAKILFEFELLTSNSPPTIK
ncbi:OsmC family protein [Betaproteobacteria bacterium]|nr:OsmC family protein [Betaproteobacteria bacterium]